MDAGSMGGCLELGQGAGNRLGLLACSMMARDDRGEWCVLQQWGCGGLSSSSSKKSVCGSMLMSCMLTVMSPHAAQLVGASCTINACEAWFGNPRPAVPAMCPGGLMWTCRTRPLPACAPTSSSTPTPSLRA